MYYLRLKTREDRGDSSKDEIKLYDHLFYACLELENLSDPSLFTSLTTRRPRDYDKLKVSIGEEN